MAREIRETTTTGTVTMASPNLRIVVDGATVDCPAYVLDVAAYTIGQRVQVRVQSPLVPVVLGVAN